MDSKEIEDKYFLALRCLSNLLTKINFADSLNEIKESEWQKEATRIIDKATEDGFLVSYILRSVK